LWQKIKKIKAKAPRRKAVGRLFPFARKGILAMKKLKKQKN
jgi:hypothetical protein